MELSRSTSIPIAISIPILEKESNMLDEKALERAEELLKGDPELKINLDYYKIALLEEILFQLKYGSFSTYVKY